MAKETNQTTETVPWEEGDATGLVLIEPTPEVVAQAYAAIQDGTLPPEIGDPNISARMVLERIKTGSFDDSMAPAVKLPNWKREYEDVDVVVYGFHMNKSTFERDDESRGSSVYAVVDLAEVGSGEMRTVQVGSQIVLMQLVKAYEERRFPFKARLISKPTATPGRTVQWLIDPTKA